MWWFLKCSKTVLFEQWMTRKIHTDKKTTLTRAYTKKSGTQSKKNGSNNDITKTRSTRYISTWILSQHWAGSSEVVILYFECRLFACPFYFGFLCVCAIAAVAVIAAATSYSYAQYFCHVLCIYKLIFSPLLLVSFVSKPLIIDFKMIDISDSIRCNLVKNKRCCIFTAANDYALAVLCLFSDFFVLQSVPHSQFVPIIEEYHSQIGTHFREKKIKHTTIIAPAKQTQRWYVSCAPVFSGWSKEWARDRK